MRRQKQQYKDMENSTQNQIQQKQPTPLQAFNRCITNSDVQSYLSQVLGEKKSSFVNNITALVANDMKLQECKPMSLIYAGIKATALDLPLDQNLGFAYVIPYKCKTGTEAQFQMGYKGFIQLAIRTGQFRTINVTEVVDGEIASENLITGEIQFVRAKDRTWSSSCILERSPVSPCLSPISQSFWTGYTEDSSISLISRVFLFSFPDT